MSTFNDLRFRFFLTEVRYNERHEVVINYGATHNVSVFTVSEYVVNERVCGIMNSSGSKVCLYETRVSYIRQVLCGSMIFSVKVEKVYIRVKEHKGINTSIAKVS